MRERPEEMGTLDISTDKITEVLEAYPIECALLYGSQLHGPTTPESDIDIAVGFAPELSAAQRLQSRIELTTELSRTLGMDAVDIADLETIRPEVGLSALETGVVLLGDQSTLDAYRKRFEEATKEETHDERMERFDGILDRLEGQV
ncbi:type VII toxin-antitoxin system MntA family adenylyltransferase antitoxin [Salinibaculum salinum]|uniref:type VII toxin-antitoxin system MntA family adenylyltransferase antitoxin n=1 Tax=Salinibaculum salinum TaxID=3131996 RepID=UPI0030EDDE21